MRVLLLMGTRPEAIKCAPLVPVLEKVGVEVDLLLTGQHRDMVAPVLSFFGVRPTAELCVMKEGQNLTELTTRLLESIAGYLARCARPDAILVHGDTTTAFAGALCAFYAGIPVYHIEAGLRSDDLRAPFPEEWNRRAIDLLSTVHFAPTAAAAERLRREGCRSERVFTVGNTATDALRLCLECPVEHPLLRVSEGRKLVLLTTHRRELSAAARAAMLRAVRREIETRPETLMIVPVHPSPAVEKTIRESLEGATNILLTPPLELPLLQHLSARATILLTDSGGLQEEATYLGLPTLVLREVTERPEGVAAGVLRVVGTDPAAVGAVLSRLLEDDVARVAMARPSKVFGDGYACERIAAIMAALLPEKRL